MSGVQVNIPVISVSYDTGALLLNAIAQGCNISVLLMRIVSDTTF